MKVALAQPITMLHQLVCFHNRCVIVEKLAELAVFGE
jgi:hypothetical protein